VINLQKQLDIMEDTLIRDALKENGYSITKASAALGLNKGNLFSRMKKLNIRTPKQLARDLEKSKEGN
jgi:transcriptional regulator with GAF, ATPase, and Fis domain